MQKIIYSDEDGNISIVIPSPKWQLEEIFGPMSENQYRKHVWDKSVPPDAIDPKEISDDDIPQDRYFRNAWRPCPEKKIRIDMPKAREIHMEKIRRHRDKRLKELDIDTMRGIDVQPQKQVLRDIPQTFDLSTAGSPEELKALWPKELSDAEQV